MRDWIAGYPKYQPAARAPNTTTTQMTVRIGLGRLGSTSRWIRSDARSDVRSATGKPLSTQARGAQSASGRAPAFNWHIFRLCHNLVDSPAMLEKRVVVGLMALAGFAIGCDDKPAVSKTTPEPMAA